MVMEAAEDMPGPVCCSVFAVLQLQYLAVQFCIVPLCVCVTGVIFSMWFSVLMGGLWQGR